MSLTITAYLLWMRGVAAKMHGVYSSQMSKLMIIGTRFHASK
jgi:hypothetical protein